MREKGIRRASAERAAQEERQEEETEPHASLACAPPSCRHGVETVFCEGRLLLPRGTHQKGHLAVLSSTVIVALTRMPVVLGGAAGSGRGSGAEVEGGSCSEEAPSALMAAAFARRV